MRRFLSVLGVVTVAALGTPALAAPADDDLGRAGSATTCERSR